MIDENLGVYIHIPFCHHKCGYCDFYSVTCYDEKKLDDYVNAVIAQFDDFFIKGGKYVVDTVYIGGGTPSVLGGKRIARLLHALAKKVVFGRDLDITVEVNPESCDKSLFKKLKAAGVNRISMGIQSADDEQLKAISRIHNFEQAQNAVALCKKLCTDNISLDLIYGLPEQDMENWKKSVNSIIELAPRHISCYALKLSEGTPMYSAGLNYPDDDLQADMYLEAVAMLEKNGYHQYEISNFAQYGFESKHNKKYWDLSPYIGFGCAAHSYFCGKRFSFTADVDKYIKGIFDKDEIVDSSDEMAFINRAGEYIMLRLRTVYGIDENDFFNRFGIEFTPFAQRLKKYVASGHALYDGTMYRLTPKGFLVSNTIIVDLLEQLDLSGEEKYLLGGKHGRNS